MRLSAIAVLCLGLTSCQSVPGKLADITNSLPLACQSAQQLLSLPATVNGGGKIATSAAKLSDKVAAYCTAAQLAAPVLASVLNSLNTQAAVLLGTGVANR